MSKTGRSTEPAVVTDLPSALAILERRADAVPFEGFRLEDNNLPGNILLVETADRSYSFRHHDILEEEALPGGRARLWVRRGSRAWRSALFSVGAAPPDQPFLVAMENLAPPRPRRIEGMPEPATAKDREVLLREVKPLAATIAAAAAAYSSACAGGDAYDNNCAHYLSDAFIRAGFDDLAAPHDCIEARCATSAKRPIRARNMWCWFEKKASQTTRKIETNTGLWAVFQLREDEYWGGHVVIVDTDQRPMKYYGTGCYWDWDQYGYKW